MKKCSVEDVKELHLFQNMNNITCEKLSSIGVVRLLKKGEHLFRDKDQVKNIYIVKSGKVALYKLTESAQKKVIFILGDNTVINDVIIDELPASINCEVFEDAEILCFKREAFIRLMNEDFELSTIIINSLALKVRRLYRQSKNTISIKVEKKLAAKLWKLSKDYGIEVEEGILINLNLSITYLADMLGIPRETISRALKTAQKKVIFILGDNTVINDVIIDELPAAINCEVFEDAEILCFKREAFIGLMNEDFELSIIIINSLALKVRRLYRQSKNTISIKVEKKLAAKLWKLSKDYGIEVEEGILINLNLSITYLADMLGIPRETISRALKILQKKELIISENKKIIVTDREELAKFFKDI